MASTSGEQFQAGDDTESKTANVVNRMLRDWLSLPDEFKSSITNWVNQTAKLTSGQIAGGKLSPVLTVAEFQAISSPVEGQEVVVAVDSSTRWRFKYDALSASSYKWAFAGGNPLIAVVDTVGSETTTSIPFVALATAGPSVALALPGDYIVELGSYIDSGGANEGWHSFDIGASAASADDAILVGSGAAAGARGSASRKLVKSGLSAVTLTSKYKSANGGSVGFWKRWISATPIRVSQ